MPKLKQIIDEYGEIQYIETDLTGQELLITPKLNKGGAFTEEERSAFGLLGKLPLCVETLEQQSARLYEQYLKQSGNLGKRVYLRNIHDMNETLFYKLLSDHLKEMLPIIYTPTVGDAVQQFSLEFRRPRGLYLSYPDRGNIRSILKNRLNPELDLIVVTDGEGVLGIGDQGIGSMEISITKLIVYILCGGINPHRVLPVVIDVGTNNEKLLNDPMYLGWRHPRLSGEAYDQFIDEIVSAIRKEFPRIFLHWEDFGKTNARNILDRYHNKMCTFNDDIQGTGAVTLAAVLAAVNATGGTLAEQRIVFLGAGTAGIGIADQLCDAMVQQGLTRKQARARFWMVDRAGLLTTDTSSLLPFQKPYARSPREISGVKGLKEVVAQVKPTILIGCSTASGAFTQEIVQTMARHVERPIIFPLSNPTSLAEAKPADLYAWTAGKALVATGSPFDPVLFQGRQLTIAQCNNAFIFPALGKGIMASQAKRLTKEMLWEAAKTLSECAPIRQNPEAPLLPDLADAQAVNMKIALAVAMQARKQGVARVDENVDLEKVIQKSFWRPKYYEYRNARLSTHKSKSFSMGFIKKSKTPPR